MRLRTERNLSQKYIALMLGITPPQVSKWEKGTSSPKREHLTKLADFYGVSLDYLMGRNDTPPEMPVIDPESAVESALNSVPTSQKKVVS